MTELVARYKPGENVPVFAGAQISAGHFVSITGAKTTNGDYPAAHTGAGLWPFGVAEMDSAPTTYAATATDRRVNTIHGGGAIARVVAGAAVTVLDEVQSDATGRAITQTSGLAVGKALTAATNAGDIIEVELYGAPGKGVPGTGNAFVEGTQQAHVADLTVTGTAASVTGSAASVTGTVGATSPGSGADGTTPNGAQWTAAVGDITDLYTTVTALAADSADIYTTLNALKADHDDIYTTLAAVKVIVDAHNDTLEEYGMQATS